MIISPTLLMSAVTRQPRKQNADPRQHLPTNQRKTNKNANNRIQYNKGGKQEKPPPGKAQKGKKKRKKRRNKNKKTNNNPAKKAKTILQKKHKEKLLQEERPRPTVIQMENGLNTISLASVNPDHFITREIQQDVTQQLIRRKIHIAMIQETHIPYDRNFIRKEYRIITSAAKPIPKKTTRRRHIRKKHSRSGNSNTQRNGTTHKPNRKGRPPNTKNNTRP